eukprot:7391385-Pyramimonas_sp.AAC.1
MPSIFACNSDVEETQSWYAQKTIQKHQGRSAVGSSGSSTSPPAVRKVNCQPDYCWDPRRALFLHCASRNT